MNTKLDENKQFKDLISSKSINYFLSLKYTNKNTIVHTTNDNIIQNDNPKKKLSIDVMSPVNTTLINDVAIEKNIIVRKYFIIFFIILEYYLSCTF